MTDRVGVPFGSLTDVAPRKNFKPVLLKSQVQGRIFKESTSGPVEFIYNNFSNEETVHTAVVGDSIVDSLFVNNCSVFFLSGGRVDQFFLLLDTLASYRNVVLILGGNDLSYYGEKGDDAAGVLQRYGKLYEAIMNLRNKPKVVACTVLKRLHDKHWNISQSNSMMHSSKMMCFKLHQDVYKGKFFQQSDGNHLTTSGFQALACAVNTILRECELK